MNEVDKYISKFPKETQTVLEKIRSIVLLETKDLSINENIAYGMPAYKLNNKPLVYFAGYEKHIGFYATPSGHEKFKQKLSIYKQGKGSVQFQLDESIPYELIKEIVKFRIQEVLNKS